MRGVSALDRALAGIPDVPVRVHVVWLPVFPSDLVPGRQKHRPVSDPRIVQSWDPDRGVSERLLAFARSSPEWLSEEERATVADPDTVLWDMVLVWPPGARWDELPQPVFHASPFIEAADQLAGVIHTASTQFQ